MSVPENLRQAIEKRYSTEDVKVVPNSTSGEEEVVAYGMLPNSTIFGWFPLGNLDELEKQLRESGEI